MYSFTLAVIVQWPHQCNSAAMYFLSQISVRHLFKNKYINTCHKSIHSIHNFLKCTLAMHLFYYSFILECFLSQCRIRINNFFLFILKFAWVQVKSHHLSGFDIILLALSFLCQPSLLLYAARCYCMWLGGNGIVSMYLVFSQWVTWNKGSPQFLKPRFPFW